MKDLESSDIYKPIKYKEWHDSVDDIIKNIDLVSYMNITGGEPCNYHLIGN